MLIPISSPFRLTAPPELLVIAASVWMKFRSFQLQAATSQRDNPVLSRPGEQVAIAGVITTRSTSESAVLIAVRFSGSGSGSARYQARIFNHLRVELDHRSVGL